MSIRWLSCFLYYCLLVLLSAHLLLFVAASQCKSQYSQYNKFKINCLNDISAWDMSLSCASLTLVCFSPCSLCEPCCVLIACKKKAKRCGLCYHFDSCKCVCAPKPLLEDVDTCDESNTFKPLVCICYEKNNPDGELGVPCGDSDVKRDTQQAKSEKDPMITSESEITIA